MTNCERIREQLPECLAGRLDKTARETVIEHLETCSACRAELAQLGTVWRGLEALREEPEPGPSMKTRFRETLAAFEAGLEQGRQSPPAPARQPQGRTASGWWPLRPAWQFALALGMLAIGVWTGRTMMTPREASPEMAQLKGQVESLRQLVALSMLQQQSPSSRLQGVTYAYQLAQPDSQVEQALLYAVNHDSNVNVRLSAVDALQKYAGDPTVRRALIDAVAVQDSPLVQVALIDLLVQLKDRDLAPELRRIARDPQSDEAVRQRAARALTELGIGPEPGMKEVSQ
jgi:HEAT repeats/Putative zinc-finger